VAGHDLGDDVLLPGLVDTHVHVNEPGRTEWEGFATATRAAAAGGVTTIVDMPLNSLPPTVSVDALETKRRAAGGQCFVDVGFWGGAVPGNTGELPKLHAAGVFGFKCFLVDSGVAEFPPLDAAGLDAALDAVDALFVVHAEDPGEIRAAPASPRYPDFLASRPPAAETNAVAWVLRAARRAGARIHILHLSSSAVLPMLRAARRDGVRVTAETCPHYLSLSAEDVPDGATEYKCCPPIRDAANRDALWEGLATGAIDCVVSDHSPCTPQLKAGDFSTAWGGIASVQLGLPVVWTQARRRGYGLADLVRWMAMRPAQLAGLTRKGRIAVGCDADLVAFAPDATFTVEPHLLRHRHPVTPYAGRRLDGVVRATWLRGRVVDDIPRGRLLARA
jgi:allantoinase